jgi:hypothetical protein
MTRLERGREGQHDGSCIGSTLLRGDGLWNKNAALSLIFSSSPSGVPPHLASIQKSRDENAPSQEMAPVAPQGKKILFRAQATKNGRKKSNRASLCMFFASFFFFELTGGVFARTAGQDQRNLVPCLCRAKRSTVIIRTAGGRRMFPLQGRPGQAYLFSLALACESRRLLPVQEGLSVFFLYSVRGTWRD